MASAAVVGRSRRAARGVEVHAEDVAFDKAEDAASAEKLRLAIERLEEEIAALGEDGSETAVGAAEKYHELRCLVRGAGRSSGLFVGHIGYQVNKSPRHRVCIRSSITNPRSAEKHA